MDLCKRRINITYKFSNIQPKLCHLPEGHDGACKEFPFLSHLKIIKPTVANKITRDSTMTTGAAWKSEDAGPNRIQRWGMLLTDEQLLDYGINMANLKPGVQAKLREKSANYDDCINVAIKLTWLVYGMQDAPEPPEEIKDYLESFLGPIQYNSTVCEVCKRRLNFNIFNNAQRGKADLETCHLNPRYHNSNNVGFGHRECNIAQGNKTIGEFYDWIEGIIARKDHI